jgi:hypothetical protein
MILKSLINVKTEWVGGPLIRILDDKCSKYAMNLFVYHDGEWRNMFEKCNMRQGSFFGPGIFSRQKWRFKVHGMVGNNLSLLYDEIYNEENKVVSVKFDNDYYGNQRDWLYQTFELANKYKFKPIVVSKFYKVFKESFKQYDIFYGLDEYEKVKDMSYSSYVIKRNDIQSATADSWEAGGVFINNSVFLKTWHHRQDWVGMNHKQVFKDIMCYE